MLLEEAKTLNSKDKYKVYRSSSSSSTSSIPLIRIDNSEPSSSKTSTIQHDGNVSDIENDVEDKTDVPNLGVFKLQL